MQTTKLLQKETQVVVTELELIQVLGKSAGMLLSKLHYWITLANKNKKIGISHDGSRWIYNTAEEWGKQVCLTSRHVHNMFSKLIDLGVVKKLRLGKKGYDRTNSYTIDYQNVNALFNKGLKTFYHEKISSSSGKNFNIIYKDTQNTNTDINKSEKLDQQANTCDESVKQVTQVKNLEKKSENQEVLNNQQQITQLQVDIQQPVQSMFNIWNEELGHKSAPTTLNLELSKWLHAAFKNNFNSNLDNWRKYCELIKTSTWIMGDGFNLTLGWALSFKTINKVMNGEHGVSKTQVAIQNPCKTLEDVERLIDALPESDKIKKERRKIMKAIGHLKYLSWFHEEKIEESQDKFSYTAPNAFVKDYWETHFYEIVKGKEIMLETTKQEIINQEPDFETIEMEKLIDALKESKKAKETRKLILKAIGCADYSSWFHQAKFEDFEGDLRLIAPNAFVEDRWETHYSWVIKNK